MSLDALTEALKSIVDPLSGEDIVTGGQVQGLTLDDEGRASFVLEVSASNPAVMQPLLEAAQKAAEGVEGVTAVSAVMTAHAEAGQSQPVDNSGHVHHDHSHHDHAHHDHAQGAPQPPKPLQGGPEAIPGVARIIAIASGKGGVGKSTVSANLAVALANKGLRVGLLDADVYGPSQPRMLGIKGRPSSPDGNVILPLRNHGVTLMSIGLLTPEDEAVIWRGPMLMGALQQMIEKVQWGRLDALLVDMPPGTGDVQLTLAQKVPVTGAVVVSTPQDIALIDARKGIDAFKSMNVPILGLIENMASFICDGCGKEHHPFGSGGAKAEAEKQGAPFLGGVPLDLAIRVGSDDGSPIVATDPGGAQAQAFEAVADALVNAPEWETVDG